MQLQDLFSNMYLCYYEGDFLRVPIQWGQNNVKNLYCKIYYIIDGECEIIIDGKSYIGKKGDFFFIPDGTCHSYHLINDKRVEKYYFHFYLEVNGHKVNDLIDLPYYTHIGINDEIMEICKSILKSAQNKSLGSGLALKSNLLMLFSFYVTMYEITPVVDIPETSNQLDKVERYINSHLGSNLSLVQLASIASIHPNYLCRLFKAHYGISPMHYVFEKRMDYSRYLLLYTQTSISDIATMVGYNDISHFSKEFKKYSMFSPKSFRARTHATRESSPFWQK